MDNSFYINRLYENQAERETLSGLCTLCNSINSEGTYLKEAIPFDSYLRVRKTGFFDNKPRRYTVSFDRITGIYSLCDADFKEPIKTSQNLRLNEFAAFLEGFFWKGLSEEDKQDEC